MQVVEDQLKPALGKKKIDEPYAMKLQNRASGNAAVQRLFVWLQENRYSMLLYFFLSLFFLMTFGLTLLIGLQAAGTMAQVVEVLTRIVLGVVLVGILGLLTVLAFFLKRPE